MAQRMYASCGAAVGLRMTAVLNRAVAVVLVSLLIEWLKSSRSQTGSRPDRGVSMYFSSCVFFYSSKADGKHAVFLKEFIVY